jgi:hypothetical protein
MKACTPKSCTEVWAIVRKRGGEEYKCEEGEQYDGETDKSGIRNMTETKAVRATYILPLQQQRDQFL